MKTNYVLVDYENVQPKDLAGNAYPQQPRSCWIGGHFTEPNEQNTQQSPGFGRNNAWQLLHS
jgi:hypothetical protein